MAGVIDRRYVAANGHAMVVRVDAKTGRPLIGWCSATHAADCGCADYNGVAPSGFGF